MEIFFIRHPKTEAPEGVCYGSTDVLPAEGELQNVISAVKAKITIPSDAQFISSPLSRCTLLAEAFANGREIKTDARIAELDFGSWELMRWKDIPMQEMDKWSRDFVNNHAPDGESFALVVERVRSFWEGIIASNDKTKIVTTHSGVLRALLVIALEASPYKVFNTELDYGDVIRVSVSSPEYINLKFL